MKHCALVSFIMVFISAALRCTTNSAGVDPGGSEITNGILVAINGLAAAGVPVAAYPECYVRGVSDGSSVIHTVTDSDGKFELPIDSGNWNLLAVDTANQVGFFMSGVGPKASLGTIRLDSLGSIAGTVRKRGELTDGVQLFVYCTGTPLRSEIALGDSTFRFESVPKGSYSLGIARSEQIGCEPGIDCHPSSGSGGVPLGDLIVTPGGETLLDTAVNVVDIGTF